MKPTYLRAIGLLIVSLAASCVALDWDVKGADSSSGAGGMSGTVTGMGGVAGMGGVVGMGGVGGVAGMGGAAGMGGMTGMGGVGGALDAGSDFVCTTPSKCPAPAGVCAMATCDGGVCGEGLLPAGTPTANQTAGDCKQVVCDDAGVASSVDDPMDVLDDGKECTVDKCLAGGPVNISVPAGQACPATATMFCDGASACVECTEGAHCVSKLCGPSGKCLPAECGDSQQNGSESDVDCGGTICTACVAGFGCLKASDCQSGVCQGDVCQTPACNDGVKNGGETGVDCGASCAPCAAGIECLIGADCVTLVCANKVCQMASCADAVKNGSETGVDCGGNCMPCGATRPCITSADCTSGVCTSGVCQAPTCSDGAKNGNETGIDCGGSCVVPEKCDGIDNDCNGSVDDGLGTVTCGLGPCQVTVPFCAGGQQVQCAPIMPTVEVCDGLDNDCDDQVDEGLGTISCGVGACAASVAACTNGLPGACNPGAPSAENCDGIDNDCNGTVDNGNPGGGVACSTGKLGLCALGATACAVGGIVCNQNVQPTAEICDGLDNDCNGTVDNGNPGGGIACSTGQAGICSAGTTACSASAVACNRNQNPTAEICNSLDDNCNGSVDESASTTYYKDNDGDGYGTPAQTVQACSAPAGYVSNNTDCNDASSTVHPGAAEVCNNIDDNCSGQLDEGLGLGISCSVGIGACVSSGTVICNGSGGTKCNAVAKNPSAEACDGVDNDCNGVVDNGNPGANAACSTGKQGICAAGLTACTAGALVCNQTNGATTETCNGVDDNCDGVVDNGNPGGNVACGTGQLGICAAGTTACTAGSVICNRNLNPTAEICDGVDNDCNGVVDNGNPGGSMACGTGQQGICAAGKTACTAGAVACVRNLNPTTEMCDGLDNDCNGVIDNGNPGGGVACTTGQAGICSAGTTSCSLGAVACNRNQSPTAETCNSLDDNCNGGVDEGVSTAYYKDNDGDGNGTPAQTLQACSAPAGYVSNNTDCNDASSTVHPGAAEVCNNIDDNCSGQLDEGLGLGTSCSVGIGACVSSGTMICNGSGGTKCSAVAKSPSTEVCDGIDNNCNGSVDEGLGVGNSCSVGSGACVSAGSIVCNGSGGTTCSAVAKSPSAEVCDGLDNNCNGSIDEGVKTTYYKDTDADGYGNPATTVQACSSPAGYVTDNTDCNDASSAVNPGAVEVCNSIDDNCSGQSDEGLGLGASCSVGVGACASSGSIVCKAGGGTKCTAVAKSPIAEICDGIDNNCNGNVDEGYGLGNSCSVGIGACASSGSIICNAGGGTKCSAVAKSPSAETCNGTDDNCNGSVDDGASSSCGLGFTCTAGTCTCGPLPDAKIVNGQCVPSCGKALAAAGLPDAAQGCCFTACLTQEVGPTFDCAHCCATTPAQPWPLVCSSPCGNGVCQAALGESSSSCPADCGCPAPAPCMGPGSFVNGSCQYAPLANGASCGSGLVCVNGSCDPLSTWSCDDDYVCLSPKACCPDSYAADSHGCAIASKCP